MTAAACSSRSTTKSVKTIAYVWTEIKNIYEATCRDFVYAYRDSDRLVLLNNVYEQLVSTPCRIVLVTHAVHSALTFYLTHADHLARQHGVIIFSMCWLRRRDDMSRVISDAETRRFRAQLIKFYTSEYDDEGDDDGDDEEKSTAAAAAAAAAAATTSEFAQIPNDNEETTDEIGRWHDGIKIDTYRRLQQFPLFERMSEDYFHYGNSNLYVSESANKSVVVEANPTDDNDDDDEVDDQEKLRFDLKLQTQKRTAQAQEESRYMSKKFYSIFDKHLQRNDNDDNRNDGSSTSTAAAAAAAAEDELVTDDMLGAGYSNRTGNSRNGDIVKAIYYLHDNEGPDRSCNLRNRIFLQFFSKFLYYAREFVICDHTGMPFHKSFRLIDPYIVKQMCHGGTTTIAE